MDVHGKAARRQTDQGKNFHILNGAHWMEFLGTLLYSGVSRRSSAREIFAFLFLGLGFGWQISLTDYS
jgi:hypothetical protein